MKNIVLFTKSYKGDLDRCVELSKSIKKHNKDNIPFYISVPKEDIDLFKANLPHYTELIEDEKITSLNQGWVGQQFVKSLFYKLQISRYYVCIDSDAYFFKDFFTTDFLYEEDIPYLIMHERETFYEFIGRYEEELNLPNIREGHEKEYESIRKTLSPPLGRKGKFYHYGISPYIWDTKIWERLDNDYQIHNLFQKHPNELKWYGEAVLSYKTPFMPSSPLFKEFHYSSQYSFYKQLEFEEKHLKKQYLGIVMQSNWDSPLKF